MTTYAIAPELARYDQKKDLGKTKYGFEKA